MLSFSELVWNARKASYGGEYRHVKDSLQLIASRCEHEMFMGEQSSRLGNALRQWPGFDMVRASSRTIIQACPYPACHLTSAVSLKG